MSSSTRAGATVTHREAPPGPRGHLLSGSMRDFQRDNLQFIQDVALRYGDVVRYRMATMTWYQVNHPDGVRRILQENNHNYGKGTLTSGILKPVVGEGLFTSEGELWLRQRRLIQPIFHRRRVTAFGGLMTDATLAMLDGWESAEGTPVDVSAEMARLTLDIATAALFHAHVGEEPEAIARAVTTLIAEVGYRFEVPFYPPLKVPTTRNRRMRAALRTIDAAVYRIIEERRRGGTDGDDLLSLLMEARDEETGAAMTDRQLRDEVITLFIAGHETTANVLAWTFYLLATHPEAESRLRAELDDVLLSEDGRRTPTVEDLARLPYARMVIEEAMRLYPPAWVTNRQARTDDEIRGYRVPAGAIVIISPYVVHRHPDFWERPEEFAPERFSPERSAGRPRQCIGKGMALVEAQLVLATVTQHHRLRLASDRPVQAQALATLRPRGGLPMTVERV